MGTILNGVNEINGKKVTRTDQYQEPGFIVVNDNQAVISFHMGTGPDNVPSCSVRDLLSVSLIMLRDFAASYHLEPVDAENIMEAMEAVEYSLSQIRGIMGVLR